MSLKGKVINIDNQIAEIEIEPDDNCKGCRGCLRGLKNNKKYKATALIPKEKNIEKNETVDIIPSEPINEALGSFLLFGLPLFGFVVSLFILSYYFPKENNYYELFVFVFSTIVSVVFAIPAIIYSNKLKEKYLNKPRFIIVDTTELCCKKIPQNNLGNKREDLLRG